MKGVIMANNVSNILKEKIVTPVANSVAAQVDNKVKNGIILRKFIWVQLGETNTGCQLVKIDLNKINVKDPSYEFTLYIKAFSQKGLFNFIVNVNKGEELAISVNCKVEGSSSEFNYKVGYYDVDASANTITISLNKDFVVKTSINECKFVSTKDTLNIDDVVLDWSDTNTVKSENSIFIIASEPVVKILKDPGFNVPSPQISGLTADQAYRIGTIDFTKIKDVPKTNNDFSKLIYADIIMNSSGFGKIRLSLTFNVSIYSGITMASVNMIESTDMVSLNTIYNMRSNSSHAFFGTRLMDTDDLLMVEIIVNPELRSLSPALLTIESCIINPGNTMIENDTLVINWGVSKVDITDDNPVTMAERRNLDYFNSFTDTFGDSRQMNGLVPSPTSLAISKGYFLKADGTWAPIKGIIRNRTFIANPDTSSSDSVNRYVIEDVEDLITAINENASITINITINGLHTSNGTVAVLSVGAIGDVYLYNTSGEALKKLSEGMTINCTIFKKDDTKNHTNAYCVYDIVNYPDVLSLDN